MLSRFFVLAVALGRCNSALLGTLRTLIEIEKQNECGQAGEASCSPLAFLQTGGMGTEMHGTSQHQVQEPPSTQTGLVWRWSVRLSVLLFTLIIVIFLAYSCTRSHADSSNAADAIEEDDLARSGGVMATSIMLCKAALGAGMLGLGSCAAKIGIGFMLAYLIAGAILNGMSIWFCGKAALSTERWSYEEISDKLYHPCLAYATGIIQSLGCLGGAASYLIVSGQIYHLLTGADEAKIQQFVVLTGVCVCLPLALSARVNSLRHLALLSVIALSCLVVVVMHILWTNGVDQSVTRHRFWVGDGRAPMLTFMNTANVVALAFGCSANVPQLTGELNPRGKGQVTRVSATTMTFACVLYVLVSVSSVLAFGVGEGKQEETLVPCMKPFTLNPFVVLALMSVMFSVLICFDFCIFPVRQFLLYVMRKARGRTFGDVQAESLSDDTSLTRWLDICSGVGVVFSAITIALWVNSVMKILEFVGAFAGAWTAFVVPALWVLRIDANAEKSFASQGVAVLVLMIGLFLFTFGTYSAVVASI